MKTKKVPINEQKHMHWSGWPFLGCVVIQIVVFILLFSIGRFTPYSIDNYRYIASSMLQVVGGMFAFIASSTLVVYQFISSFSPNSVNYFPKKIFISFLSITVIIIVLDVFTIAFLKAEFPIFFRGLLDFLISLNTYPILFSIIYILFVIKSISPHNQVTSLIQKATEASTNSARAEIVYSLEEMLLAAIRNGQGGLVRECQDVLRKLIYIFSETNVKLNKDSAHHPDHPLRILPDITERVCYSLVDNGMGNLLHFNGHVLRELSGKCYDGKRIVGVEIASAIEHICLYCLEKHHITDAKNFIADAIYCIDEESSASTMFWGCKMLIESLSAQLADNPIGALSLIEEIFIGIKHVLKHEDIPSRESGEIIDYIKKQSWIIENCNEHGFNDIPKLLNDIDQMKNEGACIS